MSVSCFRCAAPGTTVDVAKDGEIVLSGALCEHCFAGAIEHAAKLREEFEGLLEAGLSREAANARMIDKIEGKAARA